jgi:hypothetical protein
VTEDHTREPDAGPPDEAAPPDDALAHVDVSTEQATDEERREAAQADTDKATERDRYEEGRLHSRSQGDRGESGRRMTHVDMLYRPVASR